MKCKKYAQNQIYVHNSIYMKGKEEEKKRGFHSG
jgi:hypothetical protein